MNWRPITDREQIRRAIGEWEQKLSVGAEILRGHGGSLYFLPEFGVWGGFRPPVPGRSRYWNPFGKTDTGRISTIAVEINSPPRGFNPNIQGGLAISPDGSRWAIHQGFLHTRTRNITSEMFEHATVLRSVNISHSNEKTVPYFPAVNIDAPSQAMKQQLAEFVQECSRIRDLVLNDVGRPRVSNGELDVQKAENALLPEPTGYYVIPPQESKRAERLHGAVWKALVKTLSSRGLSLSNQRVGRFGPDLRTWGSTRVLFEIKAGSDAHSVQQAVGQLQLYEKLLRKPHKKVLVRPAPLPLELAGAFRALGIAVLTFSQSGHEIYFENEMLDALFQK